MCSGWVCDCFADQSELCRLFVCNDYQSVHLYLFICQQWLDSVSPSAGLDGVHFFSVWKETGISFFNCLAGNFSNCINGFLSLDPNQLALYICVFQKFDQFNREVHCCKVLVELWWVVFPSQVWIRITHVLVSFLFYLLFIINLQSFRPLPALALDLIDELCDKFVWLCV